MSDKSFLSWPFFTDRERKLAAAIEDWSAANLPVAHGDVEGLPRTRRPSRPRRLARPYGARSGGIKPAECPHALTHPRNAFAPRRPC